MDDDRSFSRRWAGKLALLAVVLGFASITPGVVLSPRSSGGHHDGTVRIPGHAVLRLPAGRVSFTLLTVGASRDRASAARPAIHLVSAADGRALAVGYRVRAGGTAPGAFPQLAVGTSATSSGSSIWLLGFLALAVLFFVAARRLFIKWLVGIGLPCDQLPKPFR